uniref:Sel1 repeat family protein n=1 Tax=Macrostomum lignano TaxID=282301 RepID=A0A1I8FED6_9PLAT
MPLRLSSQTALLANAIGGDPFGQMALAYRYWFGNGSSSETALLFLSAGESRGPRQPCCESAYWTTRRLPNGQTGAPDDDLIQYYQFLADKGDVNAQVGLGQLYFQGGRGVHSQSYGKC